MCETSTNNIAHGILFSYLDRHSIQAIPVHFPKENDRILVLVQLLVKLNMLVAT